MNRGRTICFGCMAALACVGLALLLPSNVRSHGDVAPQAVDTEGLPKLGEEWHLVNPYREVKGEILELAIRIGDSGYNQNCARCHGLGAVSGGLAPDLRYLEEDADGDEWYMDRVRRGAHQGGVTKMPGYEGLISQEAMWAIRTYIDSRPDED